MAKKTFQPHWRPNYRVNGTLPDIKVVRTDFIINGIAIALVVFAAFILFQREYRARVLGNTVSDLQIEVEAAKPSNKASLTENNRFRESAQYVVELQKFYQTPFDPHQLLIELSKSVPEGLIYKQLSMGETVVPTKGKSSAMGISIQISGEVSELPILDAYKTKLMAADFLNFEGYVLDIDESVSAPDGSMRIFPYRLNIAINPEDMQVAKKKGKK